MEMEYTYIQTNKQINTVKKKTGFQKIRVTFHSIISHIQINTWHLSGTDTFQTFCRLGHRK